MKKLVVIVILFIVATGLSATNYKETMQKSIQQLYSSKSVQDYISAANQFDRIAKMEKQEWLPLYYAAHAYIIACHFQPEAEKKDAYLDEAQKFLDTAFEITQDESELHFMQGFLYPTRMAIDPMTRGNMYFADMEKSLAKALELNPDNPRVYHLRALMTLNMPESFGGGVANALPLFKKAQEKFKIFKPKSDIHPNWGAEYNASELKGSVLIQENNKYFRQKPRGIMKKDWKKNIVFKIFLVLLMSALFGNLVTIFFIPLSKFTWELVLSNTINAVVLGGTMGVGIFFIVAILNKKLPWLQYPIRRLLAQVITTTLYCTLIILIYLLVVNYLKPHTGTTAELLQEGKFMFKLAIGLLMVASLITSAIEFFVNWKKAAVEKEKLKHEQVVLQYNALKNQVNPHFLFNNLNSLTALISKDQEKAIRYVKQLSEVYRYLLEQKDNELVMLAEELKFLESYIFLEKIRFGDHLKVKMDVHPGTQKVIPLSLQLLFENVCKHNVISAEFPMTIEIYMKGNRIVMKNPVHKKQVIKESGTGLENIKDRYAFLTNEQVQITDDGNYFMVSIPLLEEKVKKMLNVLIIEDEQLAAERMQELIHRYDESISVLGIVDSVSSAIKWFANNRQPNLIFVDIQLADGLSFEIFEKVNISCPVIFTTAYEEYAIRAFKLNSIDYLLKPFDFEELTGAMEKFRFHNKRSIDKGGLSPEVLEQVRKMITNPFKQRFIIKIGEHLKSVSVDDIHYFYSFEKGTYICTNEFRTYLIDYSLEQISEIVDPHVFFRVNRKYILRNNAIADIVSYSNSRLKVKLKNINEEAVIVSRDKVQSFKLWLDM